MRRRAVCEPIPVRDELPPKVLVVLPSAQRRGAEIQGSALAAELHRRGLDCSAVAVRAAAEGADSLDVDIVGAGHRDWRRSLAALRRACREADVVVAYGSITLPACSLAMMGLPNTLIYRNIGEPQAWLRGPLHQARTRLLYRRVDHVAALFPAAADAIGQLFGVPAVAMTTIPNARHAEAFRPPSADRRRAARERLELGPERSVVVQIGALAPEKRLDLGIDVAGLLTGADLLLVGDGPLRAELERRATVSGAAVRLLGARSDITDVLHAADVLLLTSSTEGMPGVVIEAGLAGVPAVAADVGGVSAVVASPDWLFPLDTSDEQIAAVVRTVLKDQAENGARAEAHVRQHFTWDVVGAEWCALIDRVAGPPSTSWSVERASTTTGLVSVIIPTFNAASTLGVTLDALDGIDPADGVRFEVVVSDDGSEDGTVELAERRGVRVVTADANAGPAAARNVGVAASRGEVIVMVDAGDIPLAGCLAPIAALVGDTGAGLATWSVIVHDLTTDETVTLVPEIDTDREFVGLSAAYAIRRSVFDAVGGFDEQLRFGENSDLIERALAFVSDRRLDVIRNHVVGAEVEMGLPSRAYDRRRLAAMQHILQRDAVALRSNPVRRVQLEALAAVNAGRCEDWREARRHAWNAVAHKPFDVRGWIRLLMTCCPPLTRRRWGAASSRLGRTPRVGERWRRIRNG